MSEAPKIYQLIARNIIKYRKQSGKTQEKLALDAGINRAYVGYLERVERRPSVTTLDKLARALKIELYQLFKSE